MAVVAVRDEVDVDTAPKSRQHAVRRIEEGPRRFILDLHGVPFLDSTAHGTFVGLLKRIGFFQHRLRLVIIIRRTHPPPVHHHRPPHRPPHVETVE